MGYANQDTLSAIFSNIKNTLVIKDKTEAQAIAAASTYPNNVYYTSDTHKIVVGGNVYCDIESIGEIVCGEIIADVFGEGDFSSAYEFAADTSDQANWDTSKIYYVPSSTAGMYNIYSYTNGAWSYTQSSSSPIPASNISYDKTNTPDLGNGNVQSAVEAVDAKVEDVDQRIDDEKVKLIKTWFPSTDDGISFSVSGVTVNYIATIQNNSLVFTADSGYRVRYTTTMIPKGSIVTINMYYGNPPSGWTGRDRFAITTTNPVTYIAENGSIVGLPNTLILAKNASQGSIRDYEYYVSEDCWLIFDWQNAYNPITPTVTHIFPSIFFKERLVDLYTEYYQKGVADGSGMASISGLGYNIYDYITGAVDLAGFEYGCKIYKDYIFKPTVSLREKWSRNTSLVYFPKFDMTGLPTSDTLPLYRFLQYTTNLKIVPDLTFASNVQFSLSESFQYSGVVYVGSFVNLKITNIMGCFKECRSLLSVGNLDTSLITTWRTGSNQIFVNTNTDGVKRVESLDFTSTTTGASNEAWISNGNLTGLRYIVIKNIGTASGCTSIAMTRLTQWGIPHTSYPSLTSDARQSLIDTLLTYSFDRATAEYSTCTITLSANTKALLTTEELEQITAKGYIIA